VVKIPGGAGSGRKNIYGNMENDEMNGMNSRTTILSEIKKNLGKLKRTAAVPESPKLMHQMPGAEEMIERFSTELKRVDGDIFRAESHGEAVKFIAGKIDPAEYPYLIVSRDPVLAGNSYADRLKELKKEIEVRVYDKSFSFAGIPSRSVSVVASSFLIAETGTAVLVSSDNQPRILAILSEQLFIIADVHQLAPGLGEILERIRDGKLYLAASSITLMTGPSRTADIEKVLVKGVHGPKKVMVILVG